MDLLAGCTNSKFQDLKIYLRTEVDSVVDDIRLVLDEYNSNVINVELPPCIYIFKYLF